LILVVVERFRAGAGVAALKVTAADGRITVLSRYYPGVVASGVQGGLQGDAGSAYDITSRWRNDTVASCGEIDQISPGFANIQVPGIDGRLEGGRTIVGSSLVGFVAYRILGVV